MELKMIRFGWPTPATPYYFLHLQAVELKEDAEVIGVTINGKRNRDFEAFNDDKACVPPVLHTAAAKRDLKIRIDWTRGETFEVAVILKQGENSRISIPPRPTTAIGTRIGNTTLLMW